MAGRGLVRGTSLWTSGPGAQGSKVSHQIPRWKPSLFSWDEIRKGLETLELGVLGAGGERAGWGGIGGPCLAPIVGRLWGPSKVSSRKGMGPGGQSSTSRGAGLKTGVETSRVAVLGTFS